MQSMEVRAACFTERETREAQLRGSSFEDAMQRAGTKTARKSLHISKIRTTGSAGARLRLRRAEYSHREAEGQRTEGNGHKVLRGVAEISVVSRLKRFFE